MKREQIIAELITKHRWAPEQIQLSEPDEHRCRYCRSRSSRLRRRLQAVVDRPHRARLPGGEITRKYLEAERVKLGLRLSEQRDLLLALRTAAD